MDFIVWKYHHSCCSLCVVTLYHKAIEMENSVVCVVKLMMLVSNCSAGPPLYLGSKKSGENTISQVEERQKIDLEKWQNI